MIVGHRGVRVAGIPENSPAAFARAVATGADAVELDARRTADGSVVVSHDAVTADGLVVVESTVEQLQAAGVSTLEEVLAGLPAGLGVDLELKNLPFDPDYAEDESLVQMVAGVIAPLGDRHPLLLTSFNPFTVAALHETFPDTPTGFITAAGVDVATALAVAREQHASFIVCELGSPGLDVEGVEAAHAAGVGVMLWAMGAVDELAAAAALGLDALCVDDPGRVKELLRAA